MEKRMKRNKLINMMMYGVLVFVLIAASNAEAADVVSTTPAANAVDVSAETSIIAVFSEDMDASSINADTFFVNTGTGYNLESVAGTVSYADKTATFTPSSPLNYNKTYNVALTTGIKAVSGNALESNYTWQFTTEPIPAGDYPAVVSTNPADNAADVAVNTSVTVTFSDDMNPSSLTENTFFVKTGSGYNMTDIPGTISYSGKTAMFLPDVSLAHETLYTVTVTTGVKNTENVPLQADHVWNFVTAEPGGIPGTSPEVLSVSSAKDKIVVEFSDDMNPATVKNAFAVKAVIPGLGYGVLAGDVVVTGATVTFTPVADLRSELSYTLTITAGAADTQGNPLASDYAHFITITEPEPVKITRDDKGVWFITGSEDADVYDVFEAMGYAVATDRLWQAETYRRTARGRLAEIFGESQLQTDVFMRTAGYSDEELNEKFNTLDAESQTIISGYVAGFNRRIAEIRKDNTLLPFEFAALGFIPEDWTPSDVMAWTATMLRNFDPEGIEPNAPQLSNAVLYQTLAAKFPNDFQGMFEDLRWLNDPDAQTYIPSETKARMALKTAEQIRLAASDMPDLRQAVENIIQTRQTVMDNLKKINAYVKMGSYAWTVAGSKTASGNPMIYSGPQMGFSVPSITLEGSIRAGGLNVSGMSVPGIPGIIIGRTPHHAWSMQVGHGHTVDYYLESPDAVSLHRIETIKIAGKEDIQLPVYRTVHGPVINPIPYNPETYDPADGNPIITWKYAHWGYELDVVKALTGIARASSMDEFGAAIELVAVSQHFCYADKDGNIGYWMSGRDPLRPVGEYRFPQGFIPGVAPLEWDATVLRPRATDHNTAQGYYGGWNNKSSADYMNSFNNFSYLFGPFHRAHVIDEYLSTHDNLTFEDVRDLALNIAATDSIRSGGNPWAFVAEDFSAAIQANPSTERTEALALLDGWDGHFVEGGKSAWATETIRSDAWVLTDAWIREVIRLTFADELEDMYNSQNPTILFNTILHGLAGESSGIVNHYNWFQNLSDETAPQSPDEIIVSALDNVLENLGARPWNVPRDSIVYNHVLIGQVHETPFASRSTYAHCVEMGTNGPVRIESMFPLGESGDIRMGADGTPVFNEHFFSMTPVYDMFAPRDFPLFE